jgi:hypothetical protein
MLETKRENTQMVKKLEGVILCARVEKFDVFQWTDPANGQIKPIRSLKVLLPAGDGVVSRESISIPPSMPDPSLIEGEVYALPCTVTLNKKRQQISYTLRSDLKPFPAPDMN